MVQKIDLSKAKKAVLGSLLAKVFETEGLKNNYNVQHTVNIIAEEAFGLMVEDAVGIFTSPHASIEVALGHIFDQEVVEIVGRLDRRDHDPQGFSGQMMAAKDALIAAAMEAFEPYKNNIQSSLREAYGQKRPSHPRIGGHSGGVGF